MANTQVYQGRSLIIAPSGDYKATDPNTFDAQVNEFTGCRVTILPTLNSGGGGVTVTIQGFDAGSATYYTLLASVLITGTTMVQLLVDPRITAAANTIAQAPLPSHIRVIMVGSGVRTTLTYSASLEFHR